MIGVFWLGPVKAIGIERLSELVTDVNGSLGPGNVCKEAGLEVENSGCSIVVFSPPFFSWSRATLTRNGDGTSSMADVYGRFVIW